MTFRPASRPVGVPLAAASHRVSEVWSACEPRLTGWAIATVLSALRRSWSVRRVALGSGDVHDIVGEPAGNPQARRLYVVWHSDAIVAAATHTRLAPAVLASQHRDGERVSWALRRLGYPVVRGSTRRGGARAIFALSRLARSGHDLAVTPDGPLGPAYHVGRGVIEMARRAGLAIVPVGFGVSREWKFGTWDRTRLPWPGARICIAYGPAVSVADPTVSPETVRAQLENGLARAQSVARARVAR